MFSPLTRPTAFERTVAVVVVLIFVVISNLAESAPVTTHPRLFVRQEDLPRLKSWAVSANPVFQNGLLQAAETAKTTMDTPIATNNIPYLGAGFAGLPSLPYRDDGTNGFVAYPCEDYAMLFAFMSLLYDEGTPEHEDYASRAKTLIMHVMDAAIQGPPDPAPAAPTDWNDPAQVSSWYSGNAWRRTTFAAGDRSRWHGHCFPLVVDWIYDEFTTAELEEIRHVFLLWMEQNISASRVGGGSFTTSYNDPVYLTHYSIRYAVNNYQTAHIRNMAMMSIALDASDDDPYPVGPRGIGVRGYLENTIGLWLFQTDFILRTYCQGGFSPEGFSYGPSNVGRMLQLMLALHTSGYDDPNAFSVPMPQVKLENSGFYQDFLPGLLHSISPSKLTVPGWEWRGEMYQPAYFGDANRYELAETINALGPLGVYSYLNGNTDEWNATRYVQTFMMEGGEEKLESRVRWNEDFTHAIFYFLIMDPNETAPVDPRPTMTTSHFGTGLNRLLSRTSWNEDANWFTYKMSWNNIDHQFGDANMFEFWREGEWLTKEWSGYAFAYQNACSEWHNTLSIENDFVDAGTGHNRTVTSANGSQFLLGNPAGDPVLVARSLTPEFDYLCGDATGQYNYNPLAMQVTHASRSILWLKPDHLFVYDRAETQTDGYTKRFWLGLPGDPGDTMIAGNVTTGTTPKGQHLYVTTLLPEMGTPVLDLTEPISDYGEEGAEGEWTRHRLMVEAPGDPASARFLHVLQGTDAGQSRDNTGTVDTTSSTTSFAGAFAGDTAVLFPVNLDEPFVELTYETPGDATRHLITGLDPGAGYTVEISGTCGGDDPISVTVTQGGDEIADTGGVLIVECVAENAGVEDWESY